MKSFLGKPPIEFLAAPIAGRRRRLAAALRLTARAGEADMEMVIVAPPWPDLRQPATVGPGLAAQLPLDRRIDKNPFDRRLAREGFEQKPVLRGPAGRIDAEPVRRDDVGRGHLVALRRAQAPARHRGQPYIGVETDLMRAVPG